MLQDNAPKLIRSSKKDLFTDSETWYAAFNVSQPVFQGGALRSSLRLARANWQEALFSYQQSVQNALEQVCDSLVASQKDREFREQQELLTQAAQTDQLSEVLYKNGGASYLQVLTSETNYFSAELNLVQAQARGGGGSNSPSASEYHKAVGG